MYGLLRANWVPIACLLAALAVGLAAILDHQDKTRRIDRAQVADYYCRTYGHLCGGPSWRRIEAHWQRRQVAYEVAVGALAALAVVFAGYRLVRRPQAATSDWRSAQ